jgi:ribosome-binding protein aMBF1 (putative translation factor)
MQHEAMRPVSPIGTSVAEAINRRVERSPAYREERARVAEFEQVARLVIRLRQRRGLTQQELARRAGTSHSAISRIESGQHKTSVETLRRIAKALDARLLIGFEGDAEPAERHIVAV